MIFAPVMSKDIKINKGKINKTQATLISKAVK